MWHKNIPIEGIADNLNFITPKLSRLILVEGFMGSGKSTFANDLVVQLQHNGLSTNFIQELSAEHPLYMWMPNRSIEENMTHTLTAWYKFVGTILSNDKTYILDAGFFQSTVRFLVSMNCTQEDIHKYMSAIYDVIKKIKPLMIYFACDDVRRNLEDIYTHRFGFKERHQTIVTRTPFAQNVPGAPGEKVVAFWSKYLQVTESLLALFENKIQVPPSYNNWSVAYQDIYSKLAIDPETKKELVNPHSYVGTYVCRSPQKIKMIQISFNEQKKLLEVRNDDWGYIEKLNILDTENSFNETGTGSHYKFMRNEQGAIIGVRIDTTEGQVLLYKNNS